MRQGLARFPAALLRGTGPLAPVAVHAQTDDDLAALSLEAASFDLSDRGATGRPNPGPVDAFLWLDRGIFRPGETVNAAALVRDSAGRPLDLPLRLRLRRPNGQVAAEIVPPRQEGGAIFWPLRLSIGAPYGLWTLEALTDPDAPPVGRATFRVEAFVPERLAIEAGPPPGPLVPGPQGLPVPVTARFLYGAPGAGLTGQAEMRLLTDPEPFEAWRGWRFGLAQEQFAPDLLTFQVPETDAQGRTDPHPRPAARAGHHAPGEGRRHGLDRRTRRARNPHALRGADPRARHAGRAAPGLRERRHRCRRRGGVRHRRRLARGHRRAGHAARAPGAGAADLAHRGARLHRPLADCVA